MESNQFDRLDKKLDKIFDKVILHGELLAEHKALHERNSESLDEHIRRTDLLEERMERYEKDTNAKLDVALQPIKFFKILGSIIAVLASIAAIIKVTMK